MRFFGIMLRISIEYINMGGCVLYFHDEHVAHMEGSYGVRLQGFDTWARDSMPVARFKHIRAAFHPEAVQSDLTGDKFHQLCYLSKYSTRCQKDIISWTKCFF